MDWKDLVVVVSAVIAGTVALVVPYLAYRFAIKQDHRRWYREQRASAYTSALDLMFGGMPSATNAPHSEAVLQDFRANHASIDLFASDEVRALYIEWFMHEAAPAFKVAGIDMPDLEGKYNARTQLQLTNEVRIRMRAEMESESNRPSGRGLRQALRTAS